MYAAAPGRPLRLTPAAGLFQDVLPSLAPEVATSDAGFLGAAVASVATSARLRRRRCPHWAAGPSRVPAGRGARRLRWHEVMRWIARRGARRVCMMAAAAHPRCLLSRWPPQQQSPQAQTRCSNALEMCSAAARTSNTTTTETAMATESSELDEPDASNGGVVVVVVSLGGAIVVVDVEGIVVVVSATSLAVVDAVEVVTAATVEVANVADAVDVVVDGVVAAVVGIVVDAVDVVDVVVLAVVADIVVDVVASPVHAEANALWRGLLVPAGQGSGARLLSGQYASTGQTNAETFVGE